MIEQIYTLSGLHCEACVKRVQQSVSDLPLVQSVAVTLEPQQITITSASALTAEALRGAISRAGAYQLEEMISLIST